VLPVSVVIPIRNGAPLLRYQLEALASQDFDGEWETIVADNGSTDNLPEVIDEFAGRVPRLRLVDARALKGVSYARNAGAKSSA
jgi:glycosyltransferase involved in cell wall biosynthesis